MRFTACSFAVLKLSCAFVATVGAYLEAVYFKGEVGNGGCSGERHAVNIILRSEQFTHFIKIS